MLAVFVECVNFLDCTGSADVFGLHLIEGNVREICGQICADIIDVVEFLHPDEAMPPCTGENIVRDEWCFGRKAEQEMNVPCAPALWFYADNVTVEIVERFEFPKKILEVIVDFFLIGHVLSVCESYPTPFGRVYDIGIDHVTTLLHGARNRFEVIRTPFLMVEFFDLPITEINVFRF